MTVTSTTSANSSLSNYSGSSNGTTLAQLEKQLADLEKSLTKENQSKTDSTQTKAEKVKQLQQEIQQVQMEIQQAQAKAAQKSAQKKNTPQAGDGTAAASQTGAKSQNSSNQLLDVSA